MFKKYKLLMSYIKILKNHTKDIRNHFISNPSNSYIIKDMDYDKVYRFYTVLNLKPNTTENIQKYGYRYLDNETRKFIIELNEQFKKYGLMELIGLSKADQIDENSIFIVCEFSLLKTTKIAKNIIRILSLLIISIIALIIFI